MPFQLKPVSELEKNLLITYVPGIPDISKDESISISFRQGTEMESRLVADFEMTPVTRSWDFAENGTARNAQQFSIKSKDQPLLLRYAYEVYLTMTATDILNSDGSPLFKFADSDGTKKVAGSFDNFLKKWGRLPTSLAIAIHDGCLQANPDWAPAGRIDDDEPEGEGLRATIVAP
jgi:hypothetical protein